MSKNTREESRESQNSLNLELLKKMFWQSYFIMQFSKALCRMLNIIKSIFPSFHHDWSPLDPCWLWVSLSVSASAVDRSRVTLAISLLLSCHLVSMTENHFFSNYIHSTVKWNVLFGVIGLSENSRMVTELQLITVKTNRTFDKIPEDLMQTCHWSVFSAQLFEWDHLTLTLAVQ